jgi:hypothetical protein
VGIAEEHAVSMAGGLAKQGMIPVTALYSTFLQRGYDQILQDIALLQLHVVLAIDRAGIVGDDGPTHHGVFDVGFLRQVPGMKILAPVSLAVLISGDAASFLAVDPFGTVITVLVKGTAAGFVSGLIYKLFARLCNSWKERAKPIKSEKLSKIRDLTLRYLPVLIAAIVCPIVNTGIFLIGCNLFFYSTLSEWAKALGYENAAKYMIFGLAGGNFLFELLFNVFLSPTIVRVLDLFSNKFRSKKASNIN